MSTQDKIQKLTETLLKLSSSVTLSDAIDSDSDKNAGIAASPKAVSTLASVILDAAKNASEGSDGENEIYEPLLGEVKHEIGSWWFSIDGSIPAGGLPHLGHLVSRSAYGTGWTWIETNKTVVTDEEWLAYAESHNGTCPYYSYGDGSTTFRTPSYDQSFLKVLASISGAGSVEEAGLPNITGAFQARASNNMNMLSAYPSTNKSGVISYDGLNGSVWDYSCDVIQNTNGYKNTVISIDASRSSSIYGNSDTVTPQNYGIIVGIYLVGAVSAPIGETDAAGLLNGLSALETQVAGCVRSVNGVNADTAGNVAVDFESVNTSGTNYIRYDSGLQICWGMSSCGTGYGGKTVQLPAAFKDDTYGVTISYMTSTPQTAISIGSTNTSSFIFYRNGTSGAGAFQYVAIGRWK